MTSCVIICYNLVKKYQPNCLINSRIGNGLGDYGSSGDNETDAEGNGMLYEVPATLNDTWGYKAYDQNWKNAETVLKIKNDLKSMDVDVSASTEKFFKTFLSMNSLIKAKVRIVIHH